LPGYDYTQPGAYFVTICAHERACLFGEVVGGEMHTNRYGYLVHEEWFKTAEIRPNVALRNDEWIVMPNHVHGIIRLTSAPDPVGARRRRAPTAPNSEGFGKPVNGSLPTIVRAFKSITTRRINRERGTPHADVWQANYYEHVVRDESALARLRQYIAENPIRWAMDPENVERSR
jgi:REP element-mobilizing transposase RayT